MLAPNGAEKPRTVPDPHQTKMQITNMQRHVESAKSEVTELARNRRADPV